MEGHEEIAAWTCLQWALLSWRKNWEDLANFMSRAAIHLPTKTSTLTFMIPFQLSPVDTRKRVRKAIPKFLKVACRPSPSQGCVSSHSVRPSTAVRPPTPTPFPPLPLAQEDSPRSPNSSTPRAANMKNNNMKRRPRFPTWKEKKKWGGKTQKKNIHWFFFCSRPVSCCIL